MNRATTYLRHKKALRCKQLSLSAALCMTMSMALAGTATTAPEELIGATRSFLESAVERHLQASEIQGRYEISIANLDPRLRLAHCDQALLTTLESPTQPLGRVTVRVRCAGTTPWTVFVPAQVRLFRPVVILTRPLQRESVISSQDLALREQDVGNLTQGYLTDAAQAIGKKLTRPVLADQVLQPAQLQLAEVVHKGDQVVIIAKTGTVSVRMPGEALSDGAPGEQIRVKNQRSKRVVKGRVVGPGLVEVTM